MIVDEVLQHVDPHVRISLRKDLADLTAQQTVVSVKSSETCVCAWLSFLVWDAEGIQERRELPGKLWAPVRPKPHNGCHVAVGYVTGVLLENVHKSLGGLRGRRRSESARIDESAVHLEQGQYAPALFVHPLIVTEVYDIADPFAARSSRRRVGRLVRLRSPLCDLGRCLVAQEVRGGLGCDARPLGEQGRAARRGTRVVEDVPDTRHYAHLYNARISTRGGSSSAGICGS